MLFTHYTKYIQDINKILTVGFAYVPNLKKLISDFLPFHDFSEREPQQFGMISFTELPIEQAQSTRKTFGNYGIIISNEWAFSHQIQKILYISRNGPIFHSLHKLFQYAYEELNIKSKLREGEVSSMAFTNKERAKIAGGMTYSYLLQLYEYMEPIKNSYQHEWRIVHKYPYYGYAKTKKEIIANISPPKAWANIFNVLKVEHQDINSFVCPFNEREKLKNVLPMQFQGKEINTFED